MPFEIHLAVILETSCSIVRNFFLAIFRNFSNSSIENCFDNSCRSFVCFYFWISIRYSFAKKILEFTINRNFQKPRQLPKKFPKNLSKNSTNFPKTFAYRRITKPARGFRGEIFINRISIQSKKLLPKDFQKNCRMKFSKNSLINFQIYFRWNL